MNKQLHKKNRKERMEKQMEELTLADLVFLHNLTLNFSTPVKDAGIYLKLAQKLASMAQKLRTVPTSEQEKEPAKE